MATNTQSAPPYDPATAILTCMNSIDSNGLGGLDAVDSHMGHDDLAAIEIWQYNANVLETDFTVQEIQTSDLCQWADRLPMTKAGLQPVAGLKLLIGNAVFSDLSPPPIEILRSMRDSLRHLTKSFNIPTIFCAADDYNARFWHPPQVARLGFETNESYYANLHDLTVSWTVNPQSQVTMGVLFFRSESSRLTRRRLLSNLEQVKGLIHQPMVFPFVLAETGAHISSNGLRRFGFHISNVDSHLETFYATHGAVSLTGFSAGTTFRSALVARSQRGLHATLQLVRHFLQTTVQRSPPLGHQGQSMSQSERSAVESGLRCVQQTLEALVFCAETYQARMSNQMTLIQSMLTQEDQSIGIDIAKASKLIALESKRDSSSMKTIAVVTMLFLPGTFISSLFAMPLFDWQAPRGQVMDTRLWIYFVVTIPLTGFTCAVWWAWFTLKTMRERKENDNALKDSSKQ